MALFRPGVVIIPPDKESSGNPYVSGVIMSQVDGSVVGAVPNTVTATSDGAVFADGTMVFNDHLTPLHLRVYDTDFNQIADNVVFSPSGVRNSPPAPATDFAQWCYVQSVSNAHQIRRMDKAGVVDGTTWTLTALAEAFSPDPTNTWLYYFDGSGAIQSWDLVNNVAGPTVLAAASLPAHYGTGVTMRVVPGTGDILAMMNFINGGFANSHLEVWRVAGLNAVTPGAVLTTTVLTGKPGNTDPTMQIDVGTPNTAFWTRSYDGDNDREDGCLFDQIRLSDGAILNEWRQTIVEVDGGISGGILPATCPLIPWSVPITPPSPRPSGTLVLDMRVLGQTTRWAKDVYTPAVQCRLWEPGMQVHEALLGHEDGSVTAFGGQSDQGLPIGYELQPPDFVDDDPRRFKTFGDLVLDVDPAGGNGLTILPAANNFTQPLASSLQGAGVTGRTLFTIDLVAGDGYLARSLGIRITGSDIVAPVFYLWEPSFVPKVEATLLRATDWDDAGYFGAKFVQGLLIEADTVGATHQLQVEYDDEVLSEVFTINPGNLQNQVPYSFQTPIVGAHMLRLLSLTQNLWRFYKLRWIFEPMPEAVSVWETQPTSLDFPGYHQEERILVAHMSTVDFDLSVLADSGTVTYRVPNSGGRLVKTEILEAPNKGKVYQYRFATVDLSRTLRLFLKDSETRHRAWGGAAYQVLHPWGDVSRENGGARI
jgi:hypothetical protein